MIGHVYVLSGRGRVKIGWSRQPVIRAYQVGGKLEHATTQLTMATRVERLAHRILHSKRIGRTEWFDATIEDAIAAVEAAIEVAEGRQPEPPRPEPMRSYRAVVPLSLDGELLSRVEAARARRSHSRPGRAQVMRELIRLGLEADERRK